MPLAKFPPEMSSNTPALSLCEAKHILCAYYFCIKQTGRERKDAVLVKRTRSNLIM